MIKTIWQLLPILTAHFPFLGLLKVFFFSGNIFYFLLQEDSSELRLKENMAIEFCHTDYKEEDHLNYLKSILQRFLLKKGRIHLGFVEEYALHLPFFLCTPQKIVRVDNIRTL